MSDRDGEQRQGVSPVSLESRAVQGGCMSKRGPSHSIHVVALLLGLRRRRPGQRGAARPVRRGRRGGDGHRAGMGRRAHPRPGGCVGERSARGGPRRDTRQGFAGCRGAQRVGICRIPQAPVAAVGSTHEYLEPHPGARRCRGTAARRCTSSPRASQRRARTVSTGAPRRSARAAQAGGSLAPEEE